MTVPTLREAPNTAGRRNGQLRRLDLLLRLELILEVILEIVLRLFLEIILRLFVQVVSRCGLQKDRFVQGCEYNH